MAATSTAMWNYLQQGRTAQQQRSHCVRGLPTQQVPDVVVDNEAAMWHREFQHSWQQQQQPKVLPTTSYNNVGLKRMRSGALESPGPLYCDWAAAPYGAVQQDAALEDYILALHARYFDTAPAQRPLTYGKDVCIGLSPTSVYGGCPSAASSGCVTPQDVCFGAWAPSPSCPYDHCYPSQQQCCELASPLKRLRVDHTDSYAANSFTWVHDSQRRNNYAAPQQGAPRPVHRRPPTARRSMEDLRQCVAPASHNSFCYPSRDVGVVRTGCFSQALDVLTRWSSALSLENAETVPFAYHLWCRVASSATHSRHTLDSVLAACLWVSSKLFELRMVVPSISNMSCLSGMPLKYLRRAEKAVMSWVDWAPLSEWNKL